MTAQISDQVIFMGKICCIRGIKGGKLFTPEEVGIKPVEFSTNCWKGYFCKYSVEKGFLELVEFTVGEGNLGRIKVKHGKGKEILGRKPILHRDYGCTYYEKLSYKINFTGWLLLCNGLIEELRVRAISQDAWRYKEVYELFFDNGNLVTAIDCSQKFADIRHCDVKGKNSNPPEKVSIDKFGYVTCPNCYNRFFTDKFNWDGKCHILCQQLLILSHDN